MEADWEFEVGGGAPVIEARWAGLVDLRLHPERINEIQETATFPPLASLLEALNGTHSPLWSSKCDFWEPEEPAGPAAKEAGMRTALACYIDLLPRAGEVFAHTQEAEAFCREWVKRLAPLPLPDCRVDLVIRLALAGETEGFGVTAYLSAAGRDRAAANATLATLLTGFADTIPAFAAAGTSAS